MNYGKNALTIVTILLVMFGTLQSCERLPAQHIAEDNQDVNLTGARNSSCDPFFSIALESLTFTPDEQIKLEVVLSCMDYQSIYDIDGDDKMDFDLQVRLYEINTANSEQVWFANLDSKNCVGFNCVLWDFDNYSTSFTEMFYINGAINNDAENDDDLWPPQINNLAPHTNYYLNVSLTSKNQTTIFYSDNLDLNFSVVPSSNPQPCTPFLKTYATDNSMPNESEISEYYDFRYFNDIVHNHLYLGCVDPLESYQVTWAITLYQSGDEVELGWWNVSGVEYANKTISRSVEAIHDFDGWMVYAISGSVTSNSSTSISYYPNANSGYSYDGFTVNLSDVDDDGIEDIIDNCKYTPNSNQLDFDSDSIGDVCDDDIDGDSISNSAPYDGTGEDKCPFEYANSTQDSDLDGCIDNLDQDGDGVLDRTDNCIYVQNPNQANMDGDAQGDACDGDIDGDNVTNVAPIHVSNGTGQDLCPYVDATGKDEDLDGCVDEVEAVECEVCEEPVKGNGTNTLLDPDDVGTVATVGGAGAVGGGALALILSKLRRASRFIGVDDGLEALKHLPKRKKEDAGSDHYFQRGLVRQREMTLSADKNLDDYIEDNEKEGVEKK